MPRCNHDIQPYLQIFTPGQQSYFWSIKADSTIMFFVNRTDHKPYLRHLLSPAIDRCPAAPRPRGLAVVKRSSGANPCPNACLWT
ncbi:hypothetical protein RRG08_057556 [Elysia crispata]|uniref:Uncharacterized protein n=1 Tax=Elysia crispata TaxID=231223 RepID=A0AAE0XMQ0_9GAST|nr:hypothetical protein RRG08_057556 [Elysia crispata]